MIFYDFEVCERDWLAVFIDVTNQKEHVIINDKDKLRTLYERNMSNIWVGFNNRHYDQYIMKGILLGLDPKKINDWIIIQGKEGWQYSRVFNKDGEKRNIIKGGLKCVQEHGLKYTISWALEKSQLR